MWFSENRKRVSDKDDDTKSRGPAPRKYYYSHPNLQSWILGDIFFEPNYIVCAMEKYATILEIISASAPFLHGQTNLRTSLLLRSNIDRSFEPSIASSVVNQNQFVHASTLRRRVPFSTFAPFYANDIAFHAQLLLTPPGCIARLDEAIWRKQLDNVTKAHRFEVHSLD